MSLQLRCNPSLTEKLFSPPKRTLKVEIWIVQLACLVSFGGDPCQNLCHPQSCSRREVRMPAHEQLAFGMANRTGQLASSSLPTLAKEEALQQRTR